MGPYCKFCGRRCFLLRVLIDGRSMLLATCERGMAYDREKTGQTHLTAHNPAATMPEALERAWSVLPDRTCGCRRNCPAPVKVICAGSFLDLTSWLRDKLAERPYDPDLLAQTVIWIRDIDINAGGAYPLALTVVESEFVPHLQCAIRSCTTTGVGPCCSSHNKLLCHRCYRYAHFVDVCVEGCRLCAAEGLPLILDRGEGGRVIIANVPVGSKLVGIGFEVVTGPGTNSVFTDERAAVVAALDAWAADTDPGAIPAPTISQRWAMSTPGGEVVEVVVRVEPIAPGATINVPNRATRAARRDNVLAMLEELDEQTRTVGREDGLDFSGYRDPVTGLMSGPVDEPDYPRRCRHCPQPLRKIHAGWVDPHGFMRCQKNLDHEPLPE